MCRTDVQGYFCGFYAFGFQTAQQFIGKVQTCRRRGHCALILGVHGLIAAVVFIIGRAFDIRRQGRMAVLLPKVRKRFARLQISRQNNSSARSIMTARISPSKNQFCTRFRRFGRADVRQCGMRVQYPLNQGFDFAAAGFFWPNRRAFITLVLLNTSTSPGAT